MRKKFTIWLLFFAGVFAAILGLCLWSNSHIRTVGTDAVLPDDLSHNSYVLSGWKEKLGQEFTLTLPEEISEPLSLVFCDMSSFRLFCEGEELYAYDSKESYSRTQRVVLPQREKTLHLKIEMEKTRIRDRILIGTAERTEKAMRLAYGADMVTIGIYVLIAFYSVSLYLRKRSETYLLLIGALAVVALVSALSNSSTAIPGIRNISEPVRFFRVVFCAALSAILLEVPLRGKWKMLCGWQGILGGTALLLLLYETGLGWLSNQLAYLLLIPTALACTSGCARKQPCAVTFTMFAVARESLRVFHRLIIEWPGLTAPPILFYYYLPQFSGLLFVLGSMIVVNDRFARKFSEVDQLAEQLETLNRGLDEQVAVRTDELKKANQQLLVEKERKHGMMVNIFHDLRTPIFSAQGSAEMIEPADSDSSVRLETLKTRLDTLEHMAEDLFFLAKLEEGGVRFEKFRIRLNVFCPPILQNTEALAQRKGVHFTGSVEPDLAVTGDSYRLMQAVENLIDNAVKFTPEGGHVDLIVRSDGKDALFIVTDDGPGIPPEDQEKLFERYYQGKLVREKNSTGLGLSIVKGIVDAHGGTVEVESTVGKGSVFTIRIPLEQEE